MTPSPITVEMLDGDHPLIRFSYAVATKSVGRRLQLLEVNVFMQNIEEAKTLRDALSAFIKFHERFPPPGTPEQIARQFDSPHEFRVEASAMGSFGIVNRLGEEVGDPPLAYYSAADAEDAIGEMICDDEEDRKLNRNRHEQGADE